MVWGANPITDSPPIFHKRIVHAQQNKAKVIAIDHMRCAIAARADQWVAVRSGTDGALALGMINVIINEELYDTHGVDVAGMFFFMDNTFFLLDGTEMGDRLHQIQEKNGMLLMACDQCAIERGIENKLIPGACIGCFPQLYAALGGAGVDQVITL